MRWPRGTISKKLRDLSKKFMVDRKVFLTEKVLPNSNCQPGWIRWTTRGITISQRALGQPLLNLPAFMKRKELEEAFIWPSMDREWSSVPIMMRESLNGMISASRKRSRSKNPAESSRGSKSLQLTSRMTKESDIINF